MWTCERLGFVIGVLVTVVTAAGCGAAGAAGADCFRFSDCEQGLTCAYGKCVVPPPPDPSDGGETTVSTLESGVGADENSGDDGGSLGFEAGSLGDDGATAE